ncbi:MAG: hypothetical protein JWM59_4350 [Verrucomicrobiales bacterium]|nr:hypothetical protein [Verrucomicrobiales bacterium]
MKRFLRNNGLSLVLAGLFLIFWAAQAVSGWKVHNEEQNRHHAAELTFPHYLASGHFWQATGENWESEFLQMSAYVVLTSFLFQKGSAESKDPDEPESEKDKNPQPPGKKHGFLYRNSLSLGLLTLFACSFWLHAVGGLRESNEELTEHGEPAQGLGEFLGSAEFWFQSSQNWQSEFMAVLAIVVLSIFLRQDGSPESKDINSPNSATGK